MRPRGGTFECVACSNAGRARTVVAGNRRTSLAQGQRSLGQRSEPTAGAFDPGLRPKESTYTPQVGGAPHPQLGMFPYEEIRDGQRDFTRDVMRTVARGKHLVAQAPTGIGKTAASLAPALQLAIEQGKIVFFLTSRQSQHKIAVDTLRQIRDARGAEFCLVDLVAKRDMCLRSEVRDMHPGKFPEFCASETRNKSCQYLGDPARGAIEAVQDGVLHVEELMAVGREYNICPHILALEAAKQAQVVVADYNHLFSDLRDLSLERFGVKLEDIVVIVDEAHNLPDRIKQNHGHRVTDFLMDGVLAEARRHNAGHLTADVNALRQAITNLAEKADREGRVEEDGWGDDKRRTVRLEVDELKDTFTMLRNGLSGDRILDDFVKDLNKLVIAIRKEQSDQIHSQELAEILGDWDRFQAGALRYIEFDKVGLATLNIALLDPSIPARRVFKDVHSAILMSGTLKPQEMIRDLLGLEADRTVIKGYPSPYDPRNRMLVIGKGFTSASKQRGPQMWDRMARAIGELAAAAEGNLAIFAPSYAVLREVRHAVESYHPRKLIVNEMPGLTKGDRDALLDQLEGAKRSGRGAMLFGVLGGSFSEGIDFRNNLLSAVVVIGLPLAPRDLEVRSAIGYLNAKFPGKGNLYGYEIPAMNKVLQALGRGIRGHEDRCAMLLLDERYLRAPYVHLLPDDPKPIASDDPGFTVQSFLAAHNL